MLPYQILVGLKSITRIWSNGYISKPNSVKQLNNGIKRLYNSAALLNIKHNVLVCCKITYENSSRRLYIPDNGCTFPKDSKPLNNATIHNSSQQDLNTYSEINNDIDTKPLTKDSSKQNLQLVEKWLFTHIEKAPIAGLEKRYCEPKAYLHNIYHIVNLETQIPNSLTSSFKPVKVKEKDAWSYTYHIKWPEDLSFTTVSRSKAAASLSAALKCLHWLHINGKITNRVPNIYQKKDVISALNAPEELKVNDDQLKNVNKFLEENEQIIYENVFNDNHKSLFTNEELPPEHSNSFPDSEIQMRNEYLQNKLQNRKVNSTSELPIIKFKSRILQELEKNQALVIKGDTGCGKTTQVPQFIIDSMIAKGLGSHCNMIVAQPRRISAISLAQRVAFERNETMGDTVGYQVRLQQNLPQYPGSILFCTTGILLKKIQKNLTLDNYSHVIVDEAHERSVDTDMLLILLKRAMQKNPSLKVVIMSATINADLFQEFLGCNAVEVPGSLFPVKMHFLEDMAKLGFPVKKEYLINEEESNVDCQQISDLIRWICKNKPDGAILCFLPGWSQIHKVQLLLEHYSDINQIIIPLHSKIPYMNQKTIFDPTSNGVRKIILATDIAETGITVPDVVYVVDSACHNENRWNESRGISSVDTHWVSKANIDQRKGRAGRVQKGESFHFLTKKQYMNLNDYPIPEIHRVSLEKTVLDAKTYSNEKAVDFLGSMPQPPRISIVRLAINDLQKLGALDKNEDLTPLGKRIALFAIHPKLSKALVYGTILQCLSPIATISSALSLSSDIFYGVLTDKSHIRKVKGLFDPTSDHMAVAWIHEMFLKIPNYMNKHNTYRVCKQYHLVHERMIVLHKTREINLKQLIEANLIHNAYAGNLESKENEFALEDELVRGVILAATDQILKHRNFEFKKGRFSQTGSSMAIEDNAKAQLTPESVNYKRNSWPTSFLTYYAKMHHQERRTTLIRESSLVSPLTVVLFSQGRITGVKYENNSGKENQVLLTIDGKENVKLTCNKEVAENILRFRDVMWALVNYYVELGVRTDMHTYENVSHLHVLDTCKKNMMTVLTELLRVSVQSFVTKDIKDAELLDKNSAKTH